MPLDLLGSIEPRPVAICLYRKLVKRSLNGLNGMDDIAADLRVV